MVEQTPTTINIDLRLKSGQQALSDFATANAAAAAQNAGVNDKEIPLPITGSRPTASHNALPQSTNRNDEKRPSVMEPITKPAYPGAKHDVRGFCIRHPRCRLMRSVDGKEDGGEDPNNYRMVRKICPSCGEQSLVKKERKTASHGFNPYNRDKAEKKEPSSESAKMYTKVVPKSKSAAANAPHFRKKINGNHKSENENLKSGVSDKNTKSSDDRHNTNERLQHASNTNLRSSTKVEVPLPSKSSEAKPESDKKEESRQKNQSEHHNKDEKHGRKEGLQTQKSSNAGHHDRRDNFQKQKSHNDAKFKKDELLQRQKSHDDRKTEELRRQKSQSDKQKKQTDHHESAHTKKAEPQRHEVQRQKSQSAIRQEEKAPVGGGTSIEQKKEVYKGVSREGAPQHERSSKNRSTSDDHAEVKLKRKNSSRQPPISEAKHREEAPSIMNESTGKSSTSGNGEKKHESNRRSRHVDSKLTKSQTTPERDPKNAKLKVKRQSTQHPPSRTRSLSPHHKLNRKSTTAVTKEEETDAIPAPKSLKERSKSVGHPQQRQRLAPEFHYVHQQPVSHIPKSTLSTYRSQFYDDVMAKSCLQSLMDKNLKV